MVVGKFPTARRSRSGCGRRRRARPGTLGTWLRRGCVADGHTGTTTGVAHDVPEQFVDEGDEHATYATKQATENREIRHTHPAEQMPKTPVLQQGQVIQNAPPVQQQASPHLHHDARAKEAAEGTSASVDQEAQLERIPGTPRNLRPQAVSCIPKSCRDCRIRGQISSHVRSTARVGRAALRRAFRVPRGTHSFSFKTPRNSSAGILEP